ncbi:B-cell scaffold protein with ankyrin repeats isoform X2 [Hyla sarda]|uniref:B-cell scaffold protein with ankyrin repeats isoform X2 n=1 Tax=Hyla sarda TaxID=327740 RepID=UPI0024C29F3F|nr:B-cell scaffold protein with ankyrin repeats isoform X2 [Hyla sarda]
MTKNLLVIYEESGKEWAVYLKKLITSNVQIDYVYLYDVNCQSNEVVENLTGSTWQCKLLVLTRDILKIFYENKSTNFFELLQPSHRVVLMLCGVDSPEGLYELFPFERDCHVILPDQDPHDYISIVSTVLNGDNDDKNLRPSVKATETFTKNNIGQEDMKSIHPSSVLVFPKRVSCENPGELFIILSNDLPKNAEVEVELLTKNQLIRKKPKQWSEKVFCLKAPDFPPSEVTVNVCCEEVIIASVQIEYFSTVEDLKHLLLKTIDPVPFICQAFNVHTLVELDKVLMKSLKNRISSCEYNALELTQHRKGGSSEEIPTLLHCAAKLGLKEVALLLVQSPAADHFCNVINKYGDDPAQMAEKYGHQDIQDIILQLSEKQKANQTDIPEETVGFEQEDVYVDMVECAETAQQQSSTDLCSNETDMDPVTEAKQYLQKYVVVDNKNEYVEEEINGSDKMLNLTDYHCLLIPDANSSRPFENENPSVLDETGNTNKEEEWFQHSPEDKSDWQNIKCDHNMIYPHENMYVPMPVHSIAKDLPSNDYHECLTASLLPKHNLSVQHDCFQEEDINKENMSQGACDECPEEHVLNEHDEEPVLIASTLDDVYIIFENSIKDTQRGQKPLISHNMSTPVASSTPTIASGTSYISQEKRVDDNQNVSHGELDEYSDKGSDHENEEDPLLVASTGDDLYLVFENSVKKKPRGPTSFILHSLEPPEAAANSITEGGASYIAQDQGHDERFDTQLLWEEYEDNEDPYSLIYNEDDELYIELPYETEESTRERKSFIVHRAPAPAPRPENTAPQMEDSYISRGLEYQRQRKHT